MQSDKNGQNTPAIICPFRRKPQLAMVILMVAASPDTQSLPVGYFIPQEAFTLSLAWHRRCHLLKEMENQLRKVP
jgi:hypothetical protein